MAQLFLKAAGGAWSAAATWSATSAAGVDNAGPPAATTDVVLELASGALTIDSGAVCRSIDTTSGVGTYGGTVTHNATATLSIGDGTAGAGNVALKFNSGMTYTLGSATTSLLAFISTSATQQTITTGGKTLGSHSFSGVGSSYQLADSNTIGATSTLTLTSGILSTNAQTCSWGLFSSSGALTRTMNITNSGITITGTGTTWQCGIGDPGGLTMTTTGSTITQSGTSVTFNGGAKTYNNIVQTGSGNAGMNLNVGGNTSTMTGNYTRTNTASKLDLVTFRNSVTAGTFTFNSNSSVNRLLVQSLTMGTSVTLTATTLVCTNVVDFQDITGAGAATWTTGASGATSFGDAQGNSGITFDTPVTQTYNTTSGNASTAGSWTSRVPLPQDDVVVNATTTGILIFDMPRVGKNINFTGTTGTARFNVSSTSYTIYGSLTLATGMTFTQTNAMGLNGRSSYTLTSAGQTFAASLTIQAFGGTYTLQDAMTLSSTVTLTFSNGTFDANNKTVSGGLVSSNNSLTRTISMGSGTWTLSGTGVVWNVQGTGLTLNGSSATIVLSDTSATGNTFTMGTGLTIGGLTIAARSGTTIINGTCTLGAFTVNAPNSLIFQQGTTRTLTAVAFNSSVGNVITIVSNLAGSPATLSLPSGIVAADYLSLKDSTASGGATWYAGANSTNVSGNSGWIFTAAPPQGGGGLLMLGVG